MSFLSVSDFFFVVFSSFEIIFEIKFKEIEFVLFFQGVMIQLRIIFFISSYVGGVYRNFLFCNKILFSNSWKDFYFCGDGGEEKVEFLK